MVKSTINQPFLNAVGFKTIDAENGIFYNSENDLTFDTTTGYFYIKTNHYDSTFGNTQDVTPIKRKVQTRDDFNTFFNFYKNK